MKLEHFLTPYTKISSTWMKELNVKAETINKVKRQSSEWEKIITNQTTDKELICKIYKQLMQFNIKTDNPIKQMGTRPKHISPKNTYRWLTNT